MLCPHVRRSLVAFVSVLSLSTLTGVASGQPAPTGPHPRIWLDQKTIAGLRAQSSVANGGLARASARCRKAQTEPDQYATGGWQGFEFVLTLSSCLAAYEAGGSADDLATAIKYWNVLLDDYQTVGDGAGGDDVVTHDTGYAMRTFAPYSALAYDWLHDAPGVDESLRAHARERFDAWVSYYSDGGYLRHLPGSNYEAGYAFATTLIAIAEGGEASASGDAAWADVRDIWGTDLAGGLGSSAVFDGGDWPEGWQYGPLSVLELALGARAMAENGAPVPGVAGWADSLVMRFLHGSTPATRRTFAGGDNESTTPNLDPANGALLGVILGPASEPAKELARKANADLGLTNENPLFDALAAAQSGNDASLPATAPTNYLARGTGNWFVRSSWSKDALWSVFQCSRRLVDDHQHNDAGNWVLTRGADDVIVDPSPYGSLSSLTSNAPAVDSGVLPSGYSPSQGNWGRTTGFAWTKQGASGIGVARCDYADQFRFDDTPSDVVRALRDFVFVPTNGGGTVVLVDRVVTNDPSRALHLRVRTPASLSLDGDVATATVGASSVIVRKLWSTSGVPSVRDMPTGTDCSSDNRGTCDTSRLPSGQEVRLDVDGPTAAALHVIDATAAGTAAPESRLLSGTGYRGVLLERATPPVAIIMSDASGAPPSTLVYRVPRGTGATHVVVDAPVDEHGRSDVTGAADGADCVVTVARHGGGATSFDGRGLVVRMTSACAVTEDIAPSASTSGPSSSPSGTGSRAVRVTSDAGPYDANAPVRGGSVGVSDGGASASGDAATVTVSPQRSPADRGGTSGSDTSSSGCAVAPAIILTAGSKSSHRGSRRPLSALMLGAVYAVLVRRRHRNGNRRGGGAFDGC